jgi:transcriptional accessory protein Tex/SPT6
VVKAGDVVKVKVLEVDLPRKRIALTMRLDVLLDDRAFVQVGGHVVARWRRSA